MKLTIGFSPCPNDTFIFDALINGGIDTEGLRFEPVLEDVQTLNSWATEGRLEVTKLSFPALFANADSYEVLDAGAALGNGVGPLLVGREKIDVNKISACRIAIPGKNTTANFLLRYAFPQVLQTVEMLFSDIEDAVCNGDADLGVLIHENRFTYQKRGLQKICDLGEIWEDREDLPIPLGCIAVRRDLPQAVKEKLNRLVRKSTEAALQNNGQLSSYVKVHAQAMEEDVMRQHIALYVNNFTVDLGVEGRKAIAKLFEVYIRSRRNAPSHPPLFLS